MTIRLYLLPELSQEDKKMDKIIQEAVKRLEDFGYKTNDEDIGSLERINSSIEEYIKCFCNTKDVPEGIFYAQRDCLCAELLLEKKSAGLLDLNGISFDREVKSIQEGDVNVVYSDESIDKEKRVDRLIEHFICRLRKELLNYRCVKWS